MSCLSLECNRHCQVPVPPSRPSVFYGRDDLVAELTNLVVNDEHIALIGAGGMGKSSLAKAILNEALVIEKFTERRFFVTYDGMDPSTITFETFVTRFAGALGIELAGVRPMRQICTFLRSTSALIVLDNAETFEEARGQSALQEIPPAIADVADIPGITLILTSRSRRNAPNVPWITKDIPPLDVGSAREAFFRIYRQVSRNNAEEEIMNLLMELEFHPLSINLLANAAQQNGWSPHMLLTRWKRQPSAVLDHGKGKLQSLSATMQLSLSSPSIQNFGEDGGRALAIIAFLPQGLNGDLATQLLPSLPRIDIICDVLCRQSLVYRQGAFIKMLAPIRHYVQNSSLAPLVSTCLGDVRAFYYRTVHRCSQERDNRADIIISDHLNTEHVIAFGLTQVPVRTKKTLNVCCLFLQCLRCHLPRPTALAPAIFNIVEEPSTLALKAWCLWYLGQLYLQLSQVAEAIQAFQAAEALYLTCSDHESVAHCVATCADMYICEGRFIQVQRVLDDFQRSNSWKYLSGTTKAPVWFFLDHAKAHMFTASADELFAKSMNDRDWGLNSKVWHWRAKMYHGEDIVQVKMHLKELLLQSTNNGNLPSRRDALQGLAQVSFYQGRLSETMDIIQDITEMFKGKDPQDFLWFTVSKAVVASNQGNYDFARDLINKASEPLEFFALNSGRGFLHRSYGSARIELTAGEYDRAEFHFTATIEGSDMQGNLLFKAFNIRGLGEVAFAHGNFAVAAQRFAETRSLCAEMGVPPGKLYSCYPFSALPERFEGWALFLERRSPFASAI
jgi:tetratricopeptide (TPR) repeat protein